MSLALADLRSPKAFSDYVSENIENVTFWSLSCDPINIISFVQGKHWSWGTSEEPRHTTFLDKTKIGDITIMYCKLGSKPFAIQKGGLMAAARISRKGQKRQERWWISELIDDSGNLIDELGFTARAVFFDYILVVGSHKIDLNRTLEEKISAGLEVATNEITSFASGLIPKEKWVGKTSYPYDIRGAQSVGDKKRRCFVG